MANNAHLVPGSFRPPAEWYRQRTVMRMTPEGFRETSIVGRELDCRAIVRAAHSVIRASRRTTGRKLIAMQLVDIYTAERLPLPRLVLRALDRALDLDGHFATISRNREIAELCSEGLTHDAVAAKFGVSSKTVQRNQYPVPDPWPDATAVLASHKAMPRSNDLDHQDRRARKVSRKAWTQEENVRRALAPLLARADDLSTKVQAAKEQTSKTRDRSRHSVFELALWFAERNWPLPRPVRWAVAVALGLGDPRGISQHYLEKLWRSPGPQWQLEADARGEPVIVDDGDGKPVFRAVEVEPDPRAGMRLPDRFARSVDIEAAERIRRGRPYDRIVPSSDLADKVNVAPERMTAWAATDRWKATVSSRAEYPIRNAVQLEAIALLRGRELSADDLAKAIDVEPSFVATWRQDACYRNRIAALVKRMRAAEQKRVKRLRQRLAARGTGPAS